LPFSRDVIVVAGFEKLHVEVAILMREDQGEAKASGVGRLSSSRRMPR
jgi:hypothetical protein